MIATILKQNGHDIDLFVVSRATPIEKLFGRYISEKQPSMFCLTAVSSQFENIQKVAHVVREAAPEVFIILGGHHASLAPDDAIQSPSLDAICVGEGDRAVVELASHVESNPTALPAGIPGLWVKNKVSGTIEKTPSLSFLEDLDGLPHIDRTLWEPWIVAPEEGVSVLVGRGCPYRCTYCSNHALQLLSGGKFVRYRSPGSMIDEINGISQRYPGVRDIYLEVETIGASMWNALELFGALAEYNSARPEKLSFRMNLAIHSGFVKREEKVREFFGYCQKANVVGLNIGLESGSERIRKLMRRPRYSNEELARFAVMAREYGIGVTLYALLGLPDETPKDFMETVRAVRQIGPEKVYLSIFYPYIGTDLYETARAQGLIPTSGLEPSRERRRAILDLPNFPRWRVRFEYIFFWYRAYKGIWSLPMIVAYMARAFIAPHARLDAAYRYVRNHSALLARFRKKYAFRGASDIVRL
jgi:radical SAM superfamily enzyme YgiQ (UPF0313 family)